MTKLFKINTCFLTLTGFLLLIIAAKGNDHTHYLKVSTPENSLVINNKSTLHISNVKTVKLYKINRDNSECSEQKNGQLVERGRINKCFRFVRNLRPLEVKEIIDILLSNNSFIKGDNDPFTSDFGLLFYNDKNEIITNITFSCVCNRFYSQPLLRTVMLISPTHPEYVGFNSICLKKILKIFNAPR